VQFSWKNFKGTFQILMYISSIVKFILQQTYLHKDILIKIKKAASFETAWYKFIL